MVCAIQKMGNMVATDISTQNTVITPVSVSTSKMIEMTNIPAAIHA